MNKKTTSLIIFLLSNLFLIAQIPTNGLVAYYPFNGNAKDETNKGNNGTVTGATLVNDRFGKSQSAYSFNGNNNLINLGNSETLKLPAMSFSFWASVKSFALNNKNYANQPFVSTRVHNFSTQHEAYFMGIYNSTGAIDAATTSLNGIQSVILTDSLVNLNKWYHITYAFNYDSTYLFVNGKLAGQSYKNFTSEYEPNSPVFLGHVSSETNSNYAWLNGSLDDIRIYNRVLNHTEVKQLYKEGVVSSYDISRETLEGIKTYPNPTSDYLTLEVETSLPINYSIFSENGKLIKRGNVVQSMIDVKDLSNGAYLLKLYFEEKEISTKFMKID